MTYLPWDRIRAALWAVIVGVALVGTGVTLAGRGLQAATEDLRADRSTLTARSESADMVDEIGESLPTQAVDPLLDFLRNFQRQFGATPVHAAASGYVIDRSHP